MRKEEVLRAELMALLRGGNAHMTFEEVVEDFPLARINDKAPHMPYSAWHIIEHMRRVLWDIVAFIQDPGHVSPEWPQGYFPSPAQKTDETGWRKTIRSFLAERAALEKMAADLQTDLLAPIPHAKTYTIFREILLAADHNAYHTGELTLMRQVMKAWPRGRALYDAA
ncbi:MAG: DinB family protein [Desulfobacteraceae bacterium]|nr:MAG: DinB family protein [Desulfobacteraceae bacterium]